VTILLIIGVLAAFLIAGFVFIFYLGNRDLEWKFLSLKGDTATDIGKSLLTGAVLSFALLLLQVHLDRVRSHEAEQEQFSLSVSFAKDLTGFHPEFPLTDIPLAGKTLDEAELNGQDLRGANLRAASLKDAGLVGADLRGADLHNASLIGAHLEGADLRGANLSGADLTRAVLWTEAGAADLRHADLRGAQLKNAQMDLPSSAKIEGAMVNATTCWPSDYLANFHLPSEADLRNELVREKTYSHGHTVVGAGYPQSFGYACSLQVSDIVDNLGLYLPPSLDRTGVIPKGSIQTLDQVATSFGQAPFGRAPGHIARKFEDEKFEDHQPIDKYGLDRPPELDGPLCAGTREIRGREPDVTESGDSFLAMMEPKWATSQMALIKVPTDEPGKAFVFRTGHPLPSGTTVDFYAEKGGQLVLYRLRRHVVDCKAA